MYKNGDICPICQTGCLETTVKNKTFEYKGKSITIPNYKIYYCSVCEDGIVDNKTLKETEKILTDFRRKVDGLLTSDEIKAIREKYGLTQKEFAELLDVGEKTFTRYENGQVTQSRAMDILLRYLNDDPSVIEKLKNKKYRKSENLSKEVITINYKGGKISLSPQDLGCYEPYRKKSLMVAYA